MANFTALKTAINNAIKTNGNEEITGAILQAILDAMVETLGDSAIGDLENAIATEVTNRENAVGGVAGDLAAEALARANKDNQLDNRINDEEYNRANADAALSQTMSQGFQTLGSQMTALNDVISALNAAYQNGFLYGGIATPSSSPSNNKCFYIALQGGIYTNFGGVGVVEGINIIKNDSGWKVEHIYDQTTLLNELYLLRQQVIQAITSFAPIVIEGDVTNAPDEEDLTSNANHLLQFKNNAYSPLEFSGLGRKYLRKNIAPLSESAPFNGFVEGVTAEETLSGTPTQIFWDRMNTRFVGIKDGVYYLDWTDSDNYVSVSTSLIYMYNGTPYQWTGSDFIVNETEVPNLVNCLTQDMINEANTIYVIRYDYTLIDDITIPANCVLKFDGGSVKNGTIKNISKVINNSDGVIFQNITLVTPEKQVVKLKWFNNNDSVAESLEEASKFRIVDAEGVWNIDKQAEITNDIELFGGTFNCPTTMDDAYIYIHSTDVTEKQTYSGTIDKGTNSIPFGIAGNYKYCLLQASDFYYKDSTRHGVVGEMMPIATLTDSLTEFGRFNTVCSYSNDITVQYFNTIKVNIHNCRFVADYHNNEIDGNLLGLNYCEGIITDCYFKGATTGLSVGNSFSVAISSCIFEHITWACAFTGGTMNSIVSNCTFNDHNHAWTTLAETHVAKFNTIQGCNVTNTRSPITSHANAYGTLISGNHISNCNGGVGSYSPNSTIENNLIEDCKDERIPAIYLKEGGKYNPTVINNVIKNVPNDGIQATNDESECICNITPERDIIIGNTIIYCKGTAIVDTVVFPQDLRPLVIIKNNIIDQVNYAGMAVTGRFVYIIGNIIKNSVKHYQGVVVERTSVYTYNNSRIWLKGNSFYYCGNNERAQAEISGFALAYIKETDFEGSAANIATANIGTVIGNTDLYESNTQLKGDMMFNRTSGKPQWWNGSVWVDATGATV